MTLALTGSDGQLPNAVAAIYTSTGVQTFVFSVILSNREAATTRTVNLWVNRSGTRRRLIPLDQPIAAGQSYTFNEPLTLEAGDTLEGDASAATIVDYVVSVLTRA